MADNIKIIGEILNIQQVSRYTEEDLNVLPIQILQDLFNVSDDYIEYFIYDIGNNFLYSNYNYKEFKLDSTSYLDPTSGAIPTIEIDPIKDLQNLGYFTGEFKVYYNFFNNKVSSPDAELFLKEISSDRTELRIGSAKLTNQQIEDSVLSIINEYNNSSYFVDYLANFGNNQQSVVVNVALNKAESGYEILIKLYQPLPINILEKSTLWIVKEKINPYIFDINLDRLISSAPAPQLRGPNFDIEIPNKNNIATSYQNYDNLLNNFQNVSSSYKQLLNLITSQSIDINTDYTNFTNFVFFSSAEQRVLNFYNKVKQIEDLNNNITTYTALTSSYPNLKNDLNLTTASINNIISNFDGFEYYLYFESGSLTSSLEYNVTPYPKSTTTKPFILSSTGSASASIWLAYTTASANNYDDFNQNNLLFTIPNFIRDDENNAPYVTFTNMVGHYFDNIWIYLKAVTDINLANNNLEQGISKDLVYTVLQSLGTKLYNRYGDSSNDIFLVGKNSGSINFDNNFTPSGSYLNNIPRKDLLAETYKRIYHNLPLLLKTKGTTYGLQTLISTFGITSSILNVKEYGGYLKNDTLQEYNNDKVRIVSNNIVAGNTLSPYISLQQQSTSSALFRTNDLHYVDISFSPETQIDTYASASIASSDPTWNIDNYIGDPGYLYSSSYASLNDEKLTYYNFNSSYLDYAGFIRLIQFFDSSLFKMIKDFVPARTNLSTGITINSPILERNKVSYAEPTSTSKIAVLDLELSGPTTSTEYTSLYTYLTGSKVAYYNGEISGSVIDYYSSWTSKNFNPYLFPTSSIDTDFFNHSNFNVLLNNVSSSILSTTRRLLQPIYSIVSGTLGLAGYSSSYYAELQDSNLSLESHRLSRYDGVKISSLLYNNYTSASSTYGGDISYGKTAVIDKNVRKLGLFTDIAESSFLPGRNRVSLKYLIDEYGRLTELNQRNKHWEEIQRTFIAGDYLNVSLFDNQKSSNQKTTDGNKLIFESGYTYYPILYFGGCSSDPKIYFENLLGGGSYRSTARNGITPLSISGSSPIGYPLSASYIPNIFNTVIEGSQYFAAGTLTSFPSYSAQETGDHRIQASFDLTLDITGSNQSATWSLQVYKNGVLLSENEQIFTATGGSGGGGGGGNVNVSTVAGYTGVFSGHIVRVGNSTNGSTADITANGSSEVLNLLSTTLPADGSSISVTFNINKISPSGQVGDATSVSLLVNSTPVDSYTRNLGETLSGTLTGTINRYDTIKVEIIEG